MGEKGDFKFLYLYSFFLVTPPFSLKLSLETKINIHDAFTVTVTFLRWLIVDTMSRVRQKSRENTLTSLSPDDTFN